MTVYDLNKAMYENMPAIEDFSNSVSIIHDYVLEQKGSYYMLLNNDLHYYTVFTYANEDSTSTNMTVEILSLAKELGPIKDIHRNDQNAIEFWIDYNGEIEMFLLFKYDWGVVLA